MNPLTVNVCFVMDCTASMHPWLHQAKTKMVTLVQEIESTHVDSVVRVAFVGYRDYGDQPIVVHGFKHPSQTMRLIQGIYAGGGDDHAEDVANAMERAVHLDWEGADVRIVIHIADAPAHGIEFHTSSVSDRFPRGDPYGLDPRDFVEKMSFLNIDFTFVKINHTTDMMIEEFMHCYKQGGKFRVIDLAGQTAEFGRAISRAVSDSITQHTSSQVL